MVLKICIIMMSSVVMDQYILCFIYDRTFGFVLNCVNLFVVIVIMVTFFITHKKKKT